MESEKPRRHRQGGLSTLLLLLAASFCSSAVWAAGPKLHFDIPAGDALKTLPLFCSQSKIEMLYLTEKVRGLQTHAVSGDLDASDALMQMLEGTGLEFEFDSDYSFVSIKAAEKQEEKLEAIGPATPLALVAESSARGNRRDSSGVLKQAFGAEQKLEEVVVTGTLIHGVLDIMSPLTFVTHREMKRTAYATVQDALQALPVNFGAAQSEDFGGAGNFSRGVSANLRGLGSGATLVLINGHRQPFSGNEGDFVDVSNIPWSAVERIEVLPDGASALYGSDAIAGVVNVVMKKDLDGAETQLRLGSARGGADEKLLGQLFGTDWRTGNVLLCYQYSERTGLSAGDRPYTANADKTAFGGTDYRSSRSSPGNILNPRTLIPSYGIPARQDGTALATADLLPNQINLQNRYATLDLLPDRQMHNLFFSGTQKLGERVELFAEARYSRREISQQLLGAEQLLFVPSTNPFFVNPYAGVPYVAVAYSFLNDLGPIEATATSQTYGGAVGLKADLTDAWRLTLSGSYGRENTRYTGDNQVDPVALSAALADPNPETAFNPFGDGKHNNPATLDAIRFAQRERAVSVISSGTVIADGPVLELPSGSAKLAVGGEWRQETFERGVRIPGVFSRTVESAFAELSVPLIGQPDNVRAVPRLELSLAGRYESYSDFGTTSNPKIGLRWAPSDSIKMRASWGTSFRAPKLVDIYDKSLDTATLASLRDPRSPSGSSIVLALQGSNPELKQETATTWTAGIDFAPTFLDGFTMSLTYYAINYEHRILSPSRASPFDILLDEEQWAAAITRNPLQSDVIAICDSAILRGSAAQCKAAPVSAIIDYRMRNLASTRVKGLDLKIDRTLDTRHGNFNFGLDGGYIFSFEQAVSDSSPLINIVDTVGNPLALRLRGTAEWYQHAWDQRGFGINVTVDHTGGYEDTGSQMSHGVSPLTTLDLRLSYRTARGMGSLSDIELGLNASNVFNQDPPFVNREAGYDVINAEPYGRVVSFTIQKHW
jgi:iron complex outermembrane receptor protein